MRLIYFDESGYTGNWEKGISKQPWYVLSAILIPADNIGKAYSNIQYEVDQLKIPGQHKPIGQGYEIKARDIVKGSGFWKDQQKKRINIRHKMLSFPRDYDGTAFIVGINKKAHLERYSTPHNPYLLSFEWILERLEIHLSLTNGGSGDNAICIYDRNNLEKRIQEKLSGLITDGNVIEYYDKEISEYSSKTFKLYHIHEINFGDSKHSVGLQVADFFATMAYSYFKNGMPENWGWWNILRGSLAKDNNGTVEGYGLKIFP
jgi:hypothetical protein